MKLATPAFIPPGRTSRCCNTGHPVLADPMTGLTVCSCQLQTGVQAYLSRVPSLPETTYNQSTSKTSAGSSLSDINNSAFFSTPAGDKLRPGLNLHTAALHPYYSTQHLVSPHPYSPVYPGFDLNGARRKVTNREATASLKAWLYQHRKNPYPTKGEKVMLAIMSQMTMTQVSTWFANARRRLKKESKIDDKSLDLSDIDVNESHLQNDSDSESVSRVPNSDMSDISDTEEQGVHERSCLHRLFSPDGRTDVSLEKLMSPQPLSPLIGKHTHVTGNEKQYVHTDNENVIKCDIDTNKDNTECIKRNDTNQLPQSQKQQNKSKIWSVTEMLR